MLTDFRERGREQEKNRPISSYTYPNWELNPQPFGAREDPPTNWATWPGLPIINYGSKYEECCKLGPKLRPRQNTIRPSVRSEISLSSSPFNIWPLPFQYKFLKCKSEPHVKIEGKDTDDWMCVDFGKLSGHISKINIWHCITLNYFHLQKDWDQIAECFLM